MYVYICMYVYIYIYEHRPVPSRLGAQARTSLFFYQDVSSPLDEPSCADDCVLNLGPQCFLLDV